MAGLSGAIRAGRAFIEILAKDDTSRALRQVASKFAGFGRDLARIGGTASLAIKGAFGAVIVASTALAAQAQEVSNKVDALFGDNADEVKDWAATLGQQLGRSRRQIQEFVSSAQGLFIPLGFDNRQATDMSKTITKLALDIGALHNVSDEEIMSDLESAIMGSARSLKQYGIIMDEVKVKQKLLNAGFDPDAATDQQKVIARLNVILEASDLAHGEAAASVGSFTNQAKALRAAMSDLGTTIGNFFLPLATSLVSAIRDIVAGFDLWITRSGDLGNVMNRVGEAIENAFIIASRKTATSWGEFGVEMTADLADATRVGLNRAASAMGEWARLMEEPARGHGFLDQQMEIVDAANALGVLSTNMRAFGREWGEVHDNMARQAAQDFSNLFTSWSRAMVDAALARTPPERGVAPPGFPIPGMRTAPETPKTIMLQIPDALERGTEEAFKQANAEQVQVLSKIEKNTDDMAKGIRMLTALPIGVVVTGI